MSGPFARTEDWAFAFVAIHDQTRSGGSDVQPGGGTDAAIAFLEAALAFDPQLGMRVERVMTDDGACFQGKAFTAPLRAHGLQSTRTWPYTPRIHGTTRRCIQAGAGIGVRLHVPPPTPRTADRPGHVHADDAPENTAASRTTRPRPPPTKHPRPRGHPPLGMRLRSSASADVANASRRARRTRATRAADR